MQVVWIALGDNAVFLAVVVFLGKTIVTHWLDKDLGRYKQQLSNTAAQELESLKQQLQVATNAYG